MKDYALVASYVSLAISLCAFVFAIFARYSSIKRTCVEISIDQSREYQKLLIDISILNRFIQEHREIAELIESVDYDKMKIFDIGEVNSIFNIAQREKLENFFNGKEMQKELMVKYYRLYNQMKQCESEIPDDESFIINLRIFYTVKITALINTLEYISMAFVQNVACANVVYQSLHQSFFRMVRLLYYPISIDNLQKKDHYGTNIIQLYREWQKEDRLRNKQDNQYKSIKVHGLKA